MTLSGSFTAERDGMVAYLQGDPAQVGAVPPELVDFGGNPTYDYVHATDDAFGKSGASLRAYFGTGDAGSTSAKGNIRLPQRAKKIFFSAEINLDFTQFPLDPDGAGAQLKFMRLHAVAGTHSGDPRVDLQIREIGASRVDIDGPLTSFQSRFQSDSANQLYLPVGSKTGWHRFIMFAEMPSSIGASDGRQFVRVIRHSDNTIYHAKRDYVDGELGVNPDRSWLAPPVHSYEFGSYTDDTWINAMLPFYAINIGDLVAWADLIGVNDTFERVELGNNPSMDDCTKLVLQKQVSRTTNSISFEVEEGNFAASDDIYAFVVNGDTQYTAGTLIRAGS